MRCALFIVLGLTVLAAAAPAAATTGAREHDACRSSDPARSVAGCSRIIADRTNPARIRLTAYLARGVAYDEAGNPTAALADFTAVNEFEDPDFGSVEGAVRRIKAQALLDRGVIHARLGAPDKAEKDYEAAIALDPRLSRAYRNLAAIRAGRGNLDSALDAFGHALDVDPEGAPEIRRERGEAYLKAGRPEPVATPAPEPGEGAPQAG